MRTMTSPRKQKRGKEEEAGGSGAVRRFGGGERARTPRFSPYARRPRASAPSAAAAATASLELMRASSWAPSSERKTAGLRAPPEAFSQKPCGRQRH